jgi:hypothetical protein
MRVNVSLWLKYFYLSLGALSHGILVFLTSYCPLLTSCRIRSPNSVLGMKEQTSTYCNSNFFKIIFFETYCAAHTRLFWLTETETGSCAPPSCPCMYSLKKICNIIILENTLLCTHYIYEKLPSLSICKLFYC